MSNLNAQWWYERSGAQAGPVTFAVLQDLAATGQLKPSTMVWTAGMAGWTRAEQVPELNWPARAGSLVTPAPAPAPGAPPPSGEVPPSASEATPAAGAAVPGAGPAAPSPAPTSVWGPPTPQPARSAAEAVQEVGEIDVTATILLSIVTFSVYGIVKFFQTGKAYERLVGHETRFTTWFWVFVGLLAGSAVLHTFGPLLPLLGIAAIVFQFLTLYEALKARNEGMRRWGLNAAVTSDTTHYVLLALGLALSPVLVGLILIVIQGVKWFQDWNAVRAAALMRPLQQPSAALRA